MTRIFIFQDFKSQKFWSITLEQTGFTVKYGKLGTEGQSQTKSFASEEQARKEAEKLIAAKVKKGYVESSVEDVAGKKVEAKKYALSWDEYDEGKTQHDLFNKIINDKRLPELKQIIIGPWDYEGEDCAELIGEIIKHKESFQHLDGLFIGDIESDEYETSWIEVPSYENLLDALPNLKDIKIRGNGAFSFGVKSRPNLRSIEAITGGLRVAFVDEIIQSDLPNLEKLILWIGDDEYGFEGNATTFKPLTKLGKFPKLTYLGLVNAEIQDELVTMLLESEILAQLEVLDISNGVLTDKSGQAILDNIDKIKHLKHINMQHNYFSQAMLKQLKALPVAVNVSDNESPDTDWQYPLITE